MKFLALLLTLLIAGCGGCASVDPLNRAQSTYVALSFDGATCSGTAVGPDSFVTAEHCLTGKLLSVNGNYVSVVKTVVDGNDHAILTVAGAKFSQWARWSKRPLVQGDAVTWIGGPGGEIGVLRRGYVAKTTKDGTAVDAQVWKGDSGAGVFNDAGELVGVVSAMGGPRNSSFVMMLMFPRGVFK